MYRSTHKCPHGVVHLLTLCSSSSLTLRKPFIWCIKRLQLGGNADSKHSNQSALPCTDSGNGHSNLREELSDSDANESYLYICPQALLEEWRTELARKPLAMSEMEACSVLGVQQEEGQDQAGPLSEDALKAAYRCIAFVHDLSTLSRQCHTWVPPESQGSPVAINYSSPLRMRLQH